MFSSVWLICGIKRKYFNKITGTLVETYAYVIRICQLDVLTRSIELKVKHRELMYCIDTWRHARRWLGRSWGRMAVVRCYFPFPVTFRMPHPLYVHVSQMSGPEFFVGLVNWNSSRGHRTSRVMCFASFKSSCYSLTLNFFSLNIFNNFAAKHEIKNSLSSRIAGLAYRALFSSLRWRQMKHIVLTIIVDVWIVNNNKKKRRCVDLNTIDSHHVLTDLPNHVCSTNTRACHWFIINKCSVRAQLDILLYKE